MKSAKSYKISSKSEFGQALKKALGEKKEIIECISKGEDLSKLKDKGIKFA
ncbi:MAG: hypothetical protein MI975_00040 [Cytophagales bacterium]|nr:hypothetical protein [Cytophagales bacterium]